MRLSSSDDSAQGVAVNNVSVAGTVAPNVGIKTEAHEADSI